MWVYLERCLTASAELAPLRAWLDAHLPPEARI
jgi:aminoglycoside/choline kinase family phosphotransferase